MTIRTAALDPRVTRVSDRTVARVQAVSGLVFGLFLLLHLTNLAAAVLGQGSYDRFMAGARGYYQTAVVELAGVLGAALVHMGAAVVRIRRRRRRKRHGEAKPTWRIRLHRYTGYYMMAAFAGHVAATRLPSLLGMPVDYTFVSFSLATVPAFFYPYYALLAFSGAYHLGHGTLAALGILKLRLPRGLTAPRSRAFWGYAAAGGALALLGVLALGGQLYRADTTRFQEWNALYEDVLRWAASW